VPGEDPRTVRLVLEYDGTEFSGWQRQRDRRTVQEVLEDALGELTGEPVSAVAAGRTDAGVHAAGQVVGFRTRSRIPAEGFLGGTNALLPRDVAVLRAEDAPPSFHARRDATGKHYRYRIVNRRSPAPLSARYATPVRAPLDEAGMAAAARPLLGTHDFSAFRNAGSVEGTGVRTLTRLDITREGEYLSMDVEGDGFLYRMVRNLAGTLIRAGRGRLDADGVRRILESRDRRTAGPAAPARGLCLVEVFYEESESARNRSALPSGDRPF